MTHSFLLIFSDRRPYIAPSPSATHQQITLKSSINSNLLTINY